ncbi:pseudouridine synthase [Silvibacterium dinghuense]|uniref:Pseudouridine synthase n=1 Tax=Silvibacterium dinghuense TaxID=1560006 RepID=A0A4Q1S8S2_9BACT|nr:pseudouridine synthase [Silvibacterium dinghuense]RXS93372.1 pseudouridine synthase [Silvibacterium dinghuense]GGH05287.1 hypothetical protein GCM10011586_21770 [Silvibacterium dinghuense]
MSEQNPNLERLQKIIAAAGICSRRKAEELIAEGRVQINGQVVTEPGTKADPAKDHIRVDGKLLQGGERARYYMVNKPRGYVTTVSDPENRPTIIDLIQHGRRTGERVFPVGRLDYNSEGLQLLTNDGELANALTRAASHVEKTYLVKVAGKPDASGLDELRAGVMIEKGRVGSREGRVMTAPAEIRLYRDGDNPWYEMVLIEGRNREIRKMFEEIGHHVEKIRRVGYGPLVLDLEPGEFRELTEDEVEALRKAVRTGPARAKAKAKAREAERIAAAEAKARFEEREAARKAKAAAFGLTVEEIRAEDERENRPRGGVRRGPDGRPSSPVRRKSAPSKGAPGKGKAGAGRTGSGRTGASRAGSGKSSFSRTGSGAGAGRPSSGRSGYGKSNAEGFGATKRPSGRSGFSRSGEDSGEGFVQGAKRAGSGRPASGRSGFDRSGSERAGSERPGSDRFGSERPAGRSSSGRPTGRSGDRPGSGRPSSSRPGTGRPGAGRSGGSGTGRPSSNRPPSTGRSGSGRSNSGRPGSGRSGSGRPPRRGQ